MQRPTDETSTVPAKRLRVHVLAHKGHRPAKQTDRQGVRPGSFPAHSDAPPPLTRCFCPDHPPRLALLRASPSAGPLLVQVRLLYGPLLATVTASKKAFEAMIRQNSRDGRAETFISAVYRDANSKEAQAYRLWLKEVAAASTPPAVSHNGPGALTQLLWPPAPAGSAAPQRESIKGPH